MKKLIIKSLPVLGLSLFAFQAHAREITAVYPAIYPFKAKSVQEIYDTVQTVTEDQRFMRNLGEMVTSELSEARSKSKPWTSSYWPLAKGTIADPYENSMLGYNLDIGWVDWKNNHKALLKRQEEVHPEVYELSQEKLDKLSPSEKYDLLLGDTNFSFTKRLVDYMGKWGSKKGNAYITNISLIGEDTLELAKDYVAKFSQQYPTLESAFKKSWTIKDTLSAKYALELVLEGKYSNVEDAFAEALKLAKLEGKNYVLAKKSSRMAAWEGICNGWSTAAGLVPRPRKTASFNLPNGKKLNFYPADTKGLISQFFFNSSIQNQVHPDYIDKKTKLPTIQGVLSAGTRCSSNEIEKDLWGRLYDDFYNSFTGKREAPCAGVHPAIWHMGVVNLIGKQGRSFIVERKVGTAVDNHPMYSYSVKYFNPLRERGIFFKPASEKNERTLEDVMVEITEEDQFKQFRNKKAKFIVGVEMKMTYLNYARPNRLETDSEEDDKEVDKKMMYDLELDSDLNIVGGQWRAVRSGMPMSRKTKLNHKQPDFFWVISKNYKKTTWFDDEADLRPWTNLSELPPKSWLKRAQSFHDYNVEKVYERGLNEYCTMIDKKTGEVRTVICESVTNRPQPLVNVINKLVELSK